MLLLRRPAPARGGCQATRSPRLACAPVGALKPPVLARRPGGALQRRQRHPRQPAPPVPALAAGPATAAVAAALASAGLVVASASRLVAAGTLPATTPAVLAQVAFRLLVPALQFVAVGATLARAGLQASSPPAGPRLGGWGLAALPAAAALYAALGVGAGWLAGAAAEGVLGARAQAALARARGAGWHAVARPAPSAGAAASALAAAAGAPAATGALGPPPPPGRAGTAALVTACSSFGNAVTLPTCLLSALLLPGSPASDAAAAYVALYAAGWSPLLWTVGSGLVTRAAGGGGKGRQQPSPPELAAAARVGSVALARGGAGAGRARGLGGLARAGLARALSLLTAAGRAAAASPPLAATLAALALGASPLGPALFLTPAEVVAATGVAPPALPLELSLALAAARAFIGAARTLAAGALPGQLLVLGASLSSSSSAPPPRQAGGGPPARRGLPRALWAGAVGPDGRALAAVAVVRLAIVPALGVATVAAARGAGWGVGTDPVAALVLLIQAAVPPAQTFVIMALASGDADLASRLASLIVRLYAWSAVPMSLAAIGAARWVGAG